jgi:hypothetical protein
MAKTHDDRDACLTLRLPQTAKGPNFRAGYSPFSDRLQHVAVNSWDVGIRIVELS